MHYNIPDCRCKIRGANPVRHAWGKSGPDGPQTFAGAERDELRVKNGELVTRLLPPPAPAKRVVAVGLVGVNTSVGDIHLFKFLKLLCYANFTIKREFLVFFIVFFKVYADIA